MLNEIFRDIKSIGFDLDGTLYPLTPEINFKVRECIAKRILVKNPSLQNLENALDFFNQRYEELSSGSKVLEEVGYENTEKEMNNCLAEANPGIVDLIQPNANLVTIMRRLERKYDTYLITSSPKEQAIAKLHKIGIPLNIFHNQIFSDTFKAASKSNGEAFDYILKISKYNPYQHIYVGDRLKQDILPPKKRGMKTIIVGSNSSEADLSIIKIEDIGKVL